MKTDSTKKDIDFDMKEKSTTVSAAPSEQPGPTDVETRASTLPAEIDFAEDAGGGMEAADKNSFAIPFIALLQGLSPAIRKIDGAKPGLFMNTITNELMKEVQVIPCYFQRRFVRWAPRSEGGGYRGDYSPVDLELNKVEGVSLNDEGRCMIGNDELKDTRNHYVLARNGDGIWRPALVSLSSTQIKKSKRWMSRIQGLEMRGKDGKSFTPPSYSHIYLLKSVEEKNNEGEWSGLEVDLVRPLDTKTPEEAELYLKSRAFSQSVAKGEVEVAPPPPEAGGTGDGRF